MLYVQTQLILFAGLFACMPALAAEPCTLTAGSPPATSASQLVSADNWLSPGYIRFGLGQAPRFMSGVSIARAGSPPARPVAAQRIDPDRLQLTDPADGTRRSLRFLLENRIDADGVLILRRGKVALDYRRAGFDPAQPRLLLEATRPILVTQLAKAAAEGRVAREKAITRVLPELAGVRELGKLSLQRLIDGRTGLLWSEADVALWQQEAGWLSGGKIGVRAWLGARPTWPRTPDATEGDLAGPEGELLLWAAEKAWKKSAPALLCDLQGIIRARNSAFWATDASGTPLADGLALSIGDFASLGQAFLDARRRPGRRAVAPAWFVDSIASPPDMSDAKPAGVRALGADTGWQYRFAHPGRRGHRTAIIGAYGTSLYVDFDYGTVVAVFASHADRHSPLLMASLRNVWVEVARQGGGDSGQ